MKKSGTEQYIPKIKEGFIKTMAEKYNTSKEESEKIIESFLRIIEDASDYLFSINHSYIYSFIGYICAYLRYYYPLEFVMSMLTINENKIEKTAKITQFAGKRGIKVLPIKFGKSEAGYSFVKEKNVIYKGIASIKHLNAKIANELMEVSKSCNNLDLNSHSCSYSFIDLLCLIVEKTSVNSRQLEILIKLNFFSQLGYSHELLGIYECFNSKYKKTYVEKTKNNRIAELKEIEVNKSYACQPITIEEQILMEYNLLGYITTYDNTIDYKRVLVLDINEESYHPEVVVVHFNNAEIRKYKVKRSKFYNKLEKMFFEKHDIITIDSVHEKRKSVFENDEWVNNGDFEYWIEGLTRKVINKKIEK